MDFQHIIQCADEGLVRAATDVCVEALTAATPKQGEDDALSSLEGGHRGGSTLMPSDVDAGRDK